MKKTECHVWLNAKRRHLNKKHEVWDGRRLYRYACRKTGEIPPAETTMNTDIRRKRSRVWRASLCDRMIDALCNSGCYTPDHMLILHDPYGYAPLTALLVFRTEKKCRIRVSFPGEEGTVCEQEAAYAHRVPVFMLRAGKSNELLVEIYEEDEKIGEETLYLVTGSLPRYLENMVEVQKKTEESALPYLFVYGGDTRFPYAFDEKGEIRYYLSEPPKAYGLFPLSGGRFFFLVHNISAPAFANPHAVLGCEMDLMGRTYREYLVEDGVHHDGCEMTPGGNIMTVSSSMEKYVEDAVIEIDRETGKTVRKLCLADVLSEHPYLDVTDWAHINTVSYLPEEHAVVLCARNIHSVVKIDWDTQELRWILCDTEFWKGTPYERLLLKPEEGIAWFYQAHAAYEMGEKTEDGWKKLIIFDNHWHARRPVKSFDGDKFSYVRIYAIDEENHRVRLLKSYKSRKSKIRSNGVAAGDRIFSMSGYLNKPLDGFEGIISEYDRKSAKVLNRYLTFNSFYRAYPFFADCDAYARALADLPEGGIGALLVGENRLEACEAPDISGAGRMPLIRKPYYRKMERKEVRKKLRGLAWKEEQPEYKVKKDLGEIYARLYDRLLLLFGRDHVIEKVYLCGREHTFVRDFSQTEQKSPHLFAESRYFLAVPTDGLLPDTYSIYVQCRGRLYALGKKIEKKSE